MEYSLWSVTVDVDLIQFTEDIAPATSRPGPQYYVVFLTCIVAAAILSLFYVDLVSAK